MHIVVALVVIWLLFVVLSWVLHAVKLLLIIAIIAAWRWSQPNTYCS